MAHLSRRAYARARGVTEAAIRRHLESGLLSPALLPSGLLDSEIADTLLSKGTTRPKAKRTPAILKNARSRRMRAQARDLIDEVGDYWDALVNPLYFERHSEWQFDAIRVVLRAWPAQAAPTVVGKPAADVQWILKSSVNDLLDAAGRSALDSDLEPPSLSAGIAQPPPFEPPVLDTLSPVELAALIENLRAEALELARWERLGVPRFDDAEDLLIDALSICKTLLLAIPGRTATRLEGADVDAAERILSDEIAGACNALKVDLSQLQHRSSN